MTGRYLIPLKKAILSCRHSWAMALIHKEKKHKKQIVMSSEESGKGYQKMHLTPAFFAQILTAPVGRVWRLTHFYSVASLLEKWFACHHSFPYFFILLFLAAFYDRSRMTGRYLIPLKNRTHLYQILTTPVLFLPLCPSPHFTTVQEWRAGI